jgi:hypothetical protein
MLKNNFKVTALAVVLTMVVALLPTGFTFANGTDVTLTSTLRQTELITNYNWDNSEISTLDPQLATDSVSIGPIENLFLGLTNTNALVPGQIDPELATSWAVSDDGLTWFGRRARWRPGRLAFDPEGCKNPEGEATRQSSYLPHSFILFRAVLVVRFTPFQPSLNIQSCAHSL